MESPYGVSPKSANAAIMASIYRSSYAAKSSRVRAYYRDICREKQGKGKPSIECMWGPGNLLCVVSPCAGILPGRSSLLFINEKAWPNWWSGMFH